MNAITPFLVRYHIDKWAFVTAFAVGVAIIISFELAGLDKMFAVGGCVFTMLAYAVAAVQIKALKLRPDQAADNTYYLGLLFTLTSLGLALFRFATSDLAAQSILRNFGIAIFTTIFGLMLRVFLSQFREDPEDLEFEAKEALTVTVREMRAELDRAVAQLQTFTEGTRQALDETMQDLRRQATDGLTESLGRFRDVSSLIVAAHQRDNEAVSASVRTMVNELEVVNRVLSKLSQRIEGISFSPDIVLEALNPGLTVLSEAIAGLAQDLQTQRRRLTEGTKAITSLAEAVDRLELSGTELARVAGALASMVSPLREVEIALTALSGRFEGVTHQFEGTASAAAAVVEGSASKVAATMAALNEEFSSSNASIGQVRRELAELAGWIITRLDRAA